MLVPVTEAMDWPLTAVARAVDAPPPPGAEAVRITRVETDSRAAGPGDLFAALPGTRSDGHRFLPQARAAGVSAVLRRRGSTPRARAAAPVPELIVDDTLAGYRALAAAWRARFPGPVATVAGSIGKTTTTAMLAALVAGRHPRVHATPPERNGWVGLPKTVLALRPGHGAAVLEIGTDAPGATRAQTRLAAPDVVVLTGIAEEHLDRLGDLDGVAREQADAFVETAARGGRLVVALDDPRVRAAADALRSADRLDFTMAPDAEPTDRRVVGRAGGGALRVSGGGLDRAASLSLPLPGAHNARNLLAAAAAAAALGLRADELEAGLAGFRPPRGRSDVRTLPDGTTLLADHYNASPASVRAALALAAELRGAEPAPRRVIVVLGDMLELGAEERAHHEDLADPIRALAPDAVWLHGPRMAWLARALGDGATHFRELGALADHVARHRRPGDVVLLKGSRSMRMEEVWPDPDALRFDP